MSDLNNEPTIDQSTMVIWQLYAGNKEVGKPTVDYASFPHLSYKTRAEHFPDMPEWKDNSGKVLVVNKDGTAVELLDLQGDAKKTEDRLNSMDVKLDAAIKAEEKARSDVDTKLTADIAQEAKARADGDAKNTAGMNAAIKAEANARTAMDNNLAQGISVENADRVKEIKRIDAEIDALDAKVKTQCSDLQNKLDANAKAIGTVDTNVNSFKVEYTSDQVNQQKLNTKFNDQLTSLGTVSEKGINDLKTQVTTLDKRLTDTGAKLYQDMVNVESKLTAVDAKTAETNAQQDDRLTKIEADFATKAYVQAEIKKISITDIKQVKAESNLPTAGTAYGDFYFITDTKEWKTSDGKIWLDVTAVVPDEVQAKMNKMQSDLEAKIVLVEKNAKTAWEWLKLDGYTGTNLELAGSLNKVKDFNPLDTLSRAQGGEIFKPIVYKQTIFASGDELVNKGYVDSRDAIFDKAAKDAALKAFNDAKAYSDSKDTQQANVINAFKQNVYSKSAVDSFIKARVDDCNDIRLNVYAKDASDAKYLSKAGDTMAGELRIVAPFPSIVFTEIDAVGGPKNYIIVSDGKGIRLNEDTTAGTYIWDYMPSDDSLFLYKPSTREMGTKATSLVTKAYTDAQVKAVDDKNFTLNKTALTVSLNTLGSIAHAGVYYQPGNAGATNTNMYPEQQAGTLVCTPSAWGCQQEYTTFQSCNKYIRALTSVWNGKDGPWGAWKCITPDVKNVNLESYEGTVGLNKGKQTGTTNIGGELVELNTVSGIRLTCTGGTGKVEINTPSQINVNGSDVNIKSTKDMLVRAQGTLGIAGMKGVSIYGNTDIQGKLTVNGQPLVGVAGDKGDKGDTGAQGPKGDKGDIGPAGAQGPKGDTGAQGAAGKNGAQGTKGDKGDTGPAGKDAQNVYGLGGYAVNVPNGDVNTGLRTAGGFYNGSNLVNRPAWPAGAHTWDYIWNAAHANVAGYNGMLAMDFNGVGLAFKAIEGGVDRGWKYVYHTGNKPTANDVGAVASSGDAYKEGKLSIVKAVGVNPDYHTGQLEINSGVGATNAACIGFHLPAHSAHSLQMRPDYLGLSVRAQGGGHGNISAAAFEAKNGFNFNNKTVVGGVDDSWLRLNPANSFTSGTHVIGTLQSSANIRAEGQMVINNNNPTLWMQDTDNRSCAVHCNSNLLYVLRGTGANAIAWDSGPNGRHPMTLNLETGDVVFSGNVVAYSDKRLKKDIKPIKDALSKVLQLQGVNYKRIGEDTDRIECGFIAQDLREVIPEVVHEQQDEDKTLAVDYSKIVAYMAEAIKELAARVQQLEGRA